MGNILEEDCQDDWEALTPRDWLVFMEFIRGIVGEHDWPMNVTCAAKSMQGRAAAQHFISLLKQGIIMTKLIGDGDCNAISEIRIVIEATFPGIDPLVLEAMLPELTACISHKSKNMRYCSKRYEVLMCTACMLAAELCTPCATLGTLSPGRACSRHPPVWYRMMLRM